MSTIIHVELDVLCFLILAVIRHQVRASVSQQLNRVLFRLLADGIMVSLTLDIIWVLIEGKAFPERWRSTRRSTPCILAWG